MTGAGNIDLFHRNRPNENPQNFMWKFLATTHGYKDRDKERVKVFPLVLNAAGDAEKWYQDLDQATKASWADLLKVFHARWPKAEEVTKTKND